MEELVTVATFEFPAEAESVRLLLERNGIDVFLQNDHISGTLMINAAGGVKLQVPDSQAKAARVMVDEYRQNVRLRRTPRANEGEEVVFPCDECGMTISLPLRRAGGVETCPHCGKFVDVPE